MRNTFSWVRAASLAIVLLAVAAQAQDDRKWYVRADMGGTLINNTDVKQFIGPSSGQMEFDAGYGFGISGGYHMLPWLAVELQTGYTINGISDMDAVLMQSPLTVNVVYECNKCGKFVPFIGIGGGGQTSIFAADDEVFDTGEGTVWMDGGDADIVFAYQAFGGFRYEFNERMSLGFLYRFRGSGSPEWEVEDWYTGENLGTIEVDDVFTHTFSVLFNMKF